MKSFGDGSSCDRKVISAFFFSHLHCSLTPRPFFFYRAFILKRLFILESQPLYVEKKNTKGASLTKLKCSHEHCFVYSAANASSPTYIQSLLKAPELQI